jgi:hypothetical protein
MSWKDSMTPEESRQWDELSEQIDKLRSVFKRRHRKVNRCLTRMKLGIELSKTEAEKIRERLELSAMRKRLKKQRHALMLTAHERWRQTRPAPLTIGRVGPGAP